MYKNATRAAPRVSIALRHSPETEAIKNVKQQRRDALEDDVVSDSPRDRYEALALALEGLGVRFYDGKDDDNQSLHPLVHLFGFHPLDLVTQEGNLLGDEYLAVVTSSCRAVRELEGLAGKGEVLKVLDWKTDPPQKLSGFGVECLFRNSGALQARVNEIKSRPAPKPVATTENNQKKEPPMSNTGAPSTLILPTGQLVAAPVVKPAVEMPKAAPVSKGARTRGDLVVPSEKEPGADFLGRVELKVNDKPTLAYRCVCGCGTFVLESEAMVPPIPLMRDRQNGHRVGSLDLWRHAFAPACIRRFGRGFKLEETLLRMANAQAERPDSRNVAGKRRDDNEGAFGGSGKGAPAAQLARKAARAERDREIRSHMQSAGKKKG